MGVLTGKMKKIDKYLKLILLCGFQCTQAIYLPVFAQDQHKKITIKLNDVTIIQIFDAIEAQTGYKFFFQREQLDTEKKQAINVKSINLETLLNQLFKDGDIKFRILENNVVVIYKYDNTKAVKVSGTVIDHVNRTGIPGVNVVVGGSTKGTTTDALGQFNLELSEDENNLEFSFMGYVPKVVFVNNDTILNIELEQDILNLDEVVVVGYGTQKRSDLTGSIATIAYKEINETPRQSVENELQGRAAGVQITQNSGSPGSEAMVRIRGVGTVGNSDPLYVIDGMFVNATAIKYLNPGDIESVEILKDASASAIYGSRAANGVVLISTKQGQPGKDKLEINTYSGVQEVWNTIDVCNAEEYATLYNKIRETDNKPSFFDDPAALGKGTFWQDEIFRKALVKNIELSASGGNEKSTYHISGSVLNQDGIVRKSSYQRISFRVNSSHRILPKIELGENFAFTHSLATNVAEDDEYTSITLNAVIFDPTVPVYDTSGNWTSSRTGGGNNPVALVDLTNDKTLTNSFLGTSYLKWQLLNNLSFKTSFGIDLSYPERSIFYPSYYISPSSKRDENEVRKSFEKNFTWLSENTLTYQAHFAENNYLTILLGATAQSYRRDYLEGGRRNVPSNNPDMQYLSASNDSRYFYAEGTAIESSILSALARVNYSYQNKYLVTASIRRDGSSKFGPDNRYGTFPSVSVGWKITNEPFMSRFPMVSNLKLRAGWGQIGNQEIGDYRYVTSVISGQNYTIGIPSTTWNGAAPLNIANSEIHWETCEQTNIGIDFAAFKNKLEITSDYFIKTTKNMLVNLPVPGVTGVTTPATVNAGSVQNKGIEITINYRNYNHEVKYEIGTNFSSIQNKVLSLGESGEPIYSTSVRSSTDLIAITREGGSIASFYGFKTNGLFQQSDDTNGDGLVENQPYTLSANGEKIYAQPKAAPGDVRFVDINGDGKLTSEDRTIIGSPLPKFTYGLTGSVYWKNFDLGIFLQGVYGNQIYNSLNYFLMYNGTYNLSSQMKNYWTPENINTNIPRLDATSSNENLRFSDRFIEDGSYLRIKTLSIGYTLPVAVLSKLHISKFRVYLSAQNLYSFTHYSGFDPEVGMGNQGTLDIGVDKGIYPQARVYQMGINVTF